MKKAIDSSEYLKVSEKWKPVALLHTMFPIISLKSRYNEKILHYHHEACHDSLHDARTAVGAHDAVHTTKYFRNGHT